MPHRSAFYARLGFVRALTASTALTLMLGLALPEASLAAPARRDLPPDLQPLSEARIGEIGACIWREMSETDKAGLRRSAETEPPFLVIYFAALIGNIDLFKPTKVCDPAWETHRLANYLAVHTGPIQGLALERLAPMHLDREQLDAVWRTDAGLRADLAAWQLDSKEPPSLPKARAIGAMRRAWKTLGQQDTPVMAPGSAEAAAMSYWLACAWAANYPGAPQPGSALPTRRG